MSKFDQRSQNVNKQTNIANLNLYTQHAVDPSEVLNRGLQQLKVKSYRQAIASLREAVDLDPRNKSIYKYLAIALLQGKRPKILNRNQIQEIDEVLTTASGLDSSDGVIHVFRALVRDDYYIGNRMTCPNPTVEELLYMAGSVDAVELRKLLQEVPIPKNHLYDQLLTQLMENDS